MRDLRSKVGLVGALMVALVAGLTPRRALAHEGHAPLPTKGATVRGERLMLAAGAAKAIGVQLGKVELAEVTRTISAVAAVELPWSQQAYVTTLVAGRVERVLVEPGEAVAAGQELAQIAGMELETLQLALVQACQEKALAERIVKGQEAAGEGVAGKTLLESRTQLAQQTTRFEVAWQKLKAIGLDDDSLRRICATGETLRALAIRSPIDGLVSMADVRAGQFVEPTDHLYHIVDLSRVWIVARVLEADAGKVRKGLPIEASFPALPGRVFRAPIDHVELKLNDDRTLSVKAVCDNAGGALRPGMFGRVAIRLKSKKAVVCPSEALAGDGRSFALVEQSAGNYVRKAVVVAAVDGPRAEIEEGLFPGDRVVTVGSHELAALFPKSAAPRTAVEPRAARRAQGEIELPTDQKTFASAPLQGRIRRILVEHGQRVRKGQILAELDSLALRNLQLDLLEARTSHQQAAKNLARAESLGDSVAKREVWQLRTEHGTLGERVRSLERQLALVGADDDEAVLPIRAAADALVCAFELVPGQVVAPQEQLFELHEAARVWARVYLFEQDAAQVRAGQAVEIGLASDPAFRASGRVDRLDPLLTGGNRVLSVWTELANPDLKLKEGMAAFVTLEER